MNWRIVTVVLASILSLMYIGVIFVAPLPRFLVFENIVLAAVYISAAIYLYRSGCPVPMLVISTFNLGRLSRSIVTPTGEVPPLALSHVPLFMLIFVIFLGSLYGLVRYGVHGGR